MSTIDDVSGEFHVSTWCAFLSPTRQLVEVARCTRRRIDGVSVTPTSEIMYSLPETIENRIPHKMHILIDHPGVADG